MNTFYRVSKAFFPWEKVLKRECEKDGYKGCQVLAWDEKILPTEQLSSSTLIQEKNTSKKDLLYRRPLYGR